jgi:hypothetical protein
MLQEREDAVAAINEERRPRAMAFHLSRGIHKVGGGDATHGSKYAVRISSGV